MAEYKDIVGRKIEEGDIVAVGQRSGNGGSLSVAIVLEVFSETDSYTSKDTEKIRVLGSGKNWHTDKFTVNSRYGDTFPARVVVINESAPNQLDRILRQAYLKYWGKQ